MRANERAWLPIVVLGLLILLYIAHFSALSILRHDAFLTHTRDLGNMDQPIWNTLQGRFLEETRADGRQATRLTDHFEPFFVLVSLVFLLWDDVRALLVLQTIFIALGALPIYWLARDRFTSPDAPQRGAWIGVLFAGVYLLFPALQAANLAEFHAIPLAVPLLLSAYYFGRRGDVIPFWVFSLLALTVKEEVSLLTFMLGLYLLWKGRGRWMGAVLAGVSLTWFALAVWVIIPTFAKEYYEGLEQSIYFSRYGEYGSGPKDIVLAILREPARVLLTLLEPNRLSYLAGLLASVGFLALFDPATTAIALPILLANMLSNYPAMYSGLMHYSAPLVPFFVAGAVGGAGWLVKQISARGWMSTRTAYMALTLWVLVSSMGYHVLRGYTPLSINYQRPVVTEHHRRLARFAAQIPADAPLSTTPPLFPHFSHRERIHQFPVISDAKYVLLDVASTTDLHPRDFRQLYFDLYGEDFSIVDAADGYILMRKEMPQNDVLPDAFYDFVRVEQADPAYAYRIEFGDVLRFLGFTIIDDPQWRMTKVRMYWEVLRTPEKPLRIYPFFMDREGRIIEDTTARPMVGPLWYPSSMWRPGEILRFETLPWDLGDEFSFCIGVVEGQEWADAGRRLPLTIIPTENPAYAMENRTWVRLHTFVRGPAILGSRLRPVWMAQEAKLPRYRVQIIYGDAIELLGYTIQPRSAKAGVERSLTLYWRSSQPVEKDYTVFVHLTSENGMSLPQVDAGPNWRGPLPTSAWHPGEIVPDTHRLRVPADAPPGRYHVSVGWYEWQTMERLSATDSTGQPLGDEILLTTIEVR